ncbi:hypothetical protein FGO68_gene7017 [Halteria grandinella]|uniref:Uncharacterized protein n=1 Tax=Halteria grandinella TaxID=5974 RepID=A0A8J8NMT9_HALGN|nr:hypothetical protein FGO68_gene7017 [Halteria grandinella]
MLPIYFEQITLMNNGRHLYCITNYVSLNNRLNFYRLENVDENQSKKNSLKEYILPLYFPGSNFFHPAIIKISEKSLVFIVRNDQIMIELKDCDLYGPRIGFVRTISQLQLRVLNCVNFETGLHNQILGVNSTYAIAYHDQQYHERRIVLVKCSQDKNEEGELHFEIVQFSF